MKKNTLRETLIFLEQDQIDNLFLFFSWHGNIQRKINKIAISIEPFGIKATIKVEYFEWVNVRIVDYKDTATIKIIHF